MGTEPYQIAQTLCTIIFTLSSIWATRPLDATPFFFPQEELLADWNLLQEGKPPAPIDPLR
jgi:hypothetical protein